MTVRTELGSAVDPPRSRRSPLQTRTATYPDRVTAQWATQQVVTHNEQVIHRWLAQSTRPRLTIEAAWPSREEPVGRVLLQAMMLAGRGSVDVRAARVVLRREPSVAHGFAVHATFPVYL
ncbi:RNase A-like domain-containing protein [Streptomyces sp. NPDC060002]|uniref:RNase A-like domain-containing protein n=1 Tax=Streptomyces sp. NPDC060002 TaxID=3347033 RepID=UPI0036CCF7F5